MDPQQFPDPTKFKLDRPVDSYPYFGFGPHTCLGRPLVLTSMASQLRIFGRLKNLRKAPGPQTIEKTKMIGGVVKAYMKEDWSDWTPYPSSKSFDN